MFKDNKYTKWYKNIIDAAKVRTENMVYEKHHILPKSLGGTNKKQNLVLLTPREHFIVHSILPKMLIDDKHRQKMIYAFLRMATSNTEYARIGNGKLYEKLKTNFKKYHSGKHHPFYGKRHSEKSKQKMSNSHKNKVISESTRQKMSISRTGIKQSQELIEKRTKAISKDWIITTPTKENILINNLTEFCRQNNLNKSHMSLVASGKRSHHKGHKVKRI